MPWIVSSDYYMPMVTGLFIGRNNLFFGVGHDKFLHHCQITFDFTKEFLESRHLNFFVYTNITLSYALYKNNCQQTTQS